MDTQLYKKEMQENIKIARQSIDYKNKQLCYNLNRVKQINRIKYDSLRDDINEVEKKLDRIEEVDKDLRSVVIEDINCLWMKVKILLEM